MNWKAKALAQTLFSAFPRGERLNYVCQRFVTRTLPVREDLFAQYIAFAREHLAFFQKHGTRPIETATFYEFGAGADLRMQLTLHALGVARQVLVDIRPLVRPHLINSSLARLQQRAKAGEVPMAAAPAALPTNPREARFVLRDCFGIDYRAPCDARRTGLPAGSVDYITSTNTLEHIPQADLRGILRECHRLLTPDGLLSFRVDYQDHYSYFDRRISAYNFLQYSEHTWKWCNPSLHYQNRLRHSDYLRLYENAGFEVVECRCNSGDDADRDTVRGLRLDARFSAYDVADLAIRNAWIGLRKR